MSTIKLLRQCRWCAKADQRPISFQDFYEVFSRFVTCMYCVWLMYTYLNMHLMHDEYDDAMHAFVDMEHFSIKELETVTLKFFTVKEQIYHTVQIVNSVRTTSFFVLYMQFLQVVFYFNAHPRMAVLYKTLETSAQDMVHFLMLFAVLTLFLAMMAYFQFGDQIDAYSSIMQSLKSHILMIFG